MKVAGVFILVAISILSVTSGVVILKGIAAGLIVFGCLIAILAMFVTIHLSGKGS